MRHLTGTIRAAWVRNLRDMWKNRVKCDRNSGTKDARCLMISVNPAHARETPEWGHVMGGYFSTRWNWERTRLDTAGLLRLDVRRLSRDGALTPGAVSTVRWTRGDGAPAGTIMTIMSRDRPRLTLDYKTRGYGETEWTPRQQPVWLETTPCHYGGVRVWFTCPGCQSRRAVLFPAGGVFRCRACHDLAYTSTREDAIERASRRIVTLQRKLKAPAGCDLWRIPEKPAGMHWTTYDRLARQLYEAITQREALFGAALDSLEAHTAWLLSERAG